ncbi:MULTISPECIES: MFS transporter [unclassified Lentimonas]|uniref:MFS transporter n=1 Tax=unclassified Lentimonas TaxID=2630993 RepID=UPI00132487EC|nr:MULTISPECIES: MFS transporter [unclassified Lentimonas]CAA6679267.1 Unannotated [Lentimonas sp. CC4]CAA6686301.1 Unannotated [Lentimonas sp. CC6]CAA7076077.1 Unannotated [Lentimonas sp. CC4]CAA7170930.1 Unannotated [Lentimonas sp. CC21]CAA7181127.1 Unannotated [Lentimonas sp. CC8]
MEYCERTYENYLKDGYKRNYFVNIFDVGFYSFGINIASREVIVPALLIYLGAGNVVLSLIPSLMLIGSTLPQLLFSSKVEGMPRVFPFLRIICILQRIPWLLFAIALPLLADRHNNALIALFILSSLFSWIMAGIGKPAWSELMAKSMPSHKLGPLFSHMALIGSACTIAGSFLVGYIMKNDALAFPYNYTIIFGLSAMMLWFSFFFFNLNREPASRPAHDYQHTDLRTYLASLPQIFKNDSDLKRITLARILGQSNTIALAFLMVYAIKVAACSNADIGRFVILGTIGATVTSIAFGHLSARIGARKCLMLSALFCILTLTIPLLSISIAALSVAFIFQAMNKTSQQICSDLLVINHAGSKKRPTHIALAGTLSAPFLILYALGAAALVEFTGFTLPFLIAILCNIGAILVLLKLPEPTKHS